MLCVCGIRRVVCSPSSAMMNRLLYLSATMPALAGEPAKTVWYRMDWGTSHPLTLWMITPVKYFNSCQVKPYLRIHLKKCDVVWLIWLFSNPSHPQTFMWIYANTFRFSFFLSKTRCVKTAVDLMISILLKAETLLNSWFKAHDWALCHPFFFSLYSKIS